MKSDNRQTHSRAAPKHIDLFSNCCLIKSKSTILAALHWLNDSTWNFESMLKISQFGNENISWTNLNAFFNASTDNNLSGAEDFTGFNLLDERSTMYIPSGFGGSRKAVLKFLRYTRQKDQATWEKSLSTFPQKFNNNLVAAIITTHPPFSSALLTEYFCDVSWKKDHELRPRFAFNRL